MDKDNALVVFQDKQIRRTWHEDQWYFSVVDIIQALTGSPDSKDYWYRLKKREEESGGIQLSTICRQLKLLSSDGKNYETDCANTKSVFRIIQSIPSPRAEPFKRWLAKVGYERIEEIQNPELAQKRMWELYRAKGYSDEWIETRLRGMMVREDLAGEWKKRAVQEGKEFAILTAEISKATFDMTPNEYKEFKNLKNQNLRDHMDGLELIFTMLGEASTTHIARGKDAIGFVQNKGAAREGGVVAGNARKELELKSGEKVSTPENYLAVPESQKRLEQKNRKMNLEVQTE